MSTNSAHTKVFGRDIAVRELLRPLEPFFAIDGVTEIVVNRPGEVLFELGAQWKAVSVPDLAADRLQALARAIATYCDQDISARSPMLSAILPDGQRIQIMVPPAVAPQRISLSIRLPSRTLRSLCDYQTDGAFDRFVWPAAAKVGLQPCDLSNDDTALQDALHRRDLLGFLTSAVRERRNIAVVGDTGSGKTTLMKALCEQIPQEERLITIEDVQELTLPNHLNVVNLLYSKGGQGVADISPADLIAASMRMRPDRVLLAELRGSEAFDFLKLLTTGHRGSITSFHAESCALAVERFVLMAKEHGDAAIFDANGLKRLVRLTFDVVLHVRAERAEGEHGEWIKRSYVNEVHFDPVARQHEGHHNQVLTRGVAA